MLAPIAVLLCGVLNNVQAPVKVAAGTEIRLRVAQSLRTPSGASGLSLSAENGIDGLYVVQQDGAIYGSVFRRIVLAGLTFPQAEALIKRSLAKLVKPEFLFVQLTSTIVPRVYVVGSSATAPIPLDRPMTVRQVLSVAPKAGPTPVEDLDVLEVQLVRDGKVVGRSPYLSVLRGTSALSNEQLRPSDTVLYIPAESMRIWFAGGVEHPGELRVPAGIDLQRALALAGGPKKNTTGQRVRIDVRRGTDVSQFDYAGLSLGKEFNLQPGDVVTVAEPITVTVGGSVNKSGEVLVQDGASLLEAISAAGGLDPNGTLGSVLLYRKGEVSRFDLRLALLNHQNAPTVALGDFIFVEKNLRYVGVYGAVTKQGQVMIPDEKPLRLSDALAGAGGLGPDGSFRRMFLARPAADGHYVVTQVNFDEYLKDGKLAANPELKSGDMVLVNGSKGVTAKDVLPLLSAFTFLGIKL